MIELDHVTNGRAEYTFKCGWIDWSHAGGNPNGGDAQTRDDIRLLWDQFDRAPLRPDGGFVVSHEPDVDSYTSRCYPLQRRETSEGYDTVGSRWRYFVRHSMDRERYKRVAFDIYRRGCMFAERLQQVCLLNAVSGSAYSFEDLVSNLLAFYRHLEHWNKPRILDVCGALQRDPDRISVSARVHAAMEKFRVDQRTLRASNWSQAYLLNDLAVPELKGSPVHGGPYLLQRMWVALPPQMQRLRPPPPQEHWYWVHPNADLERLYLRSSP